MFILVNGYLFICVFFRKISEMLLFSIDLDSYIISSLHLGREYAPNICPRTGRHYLFREAISSPRAKLEENCKFQGTENVLLKIKISEHIFFTSNADYNYCHPSSIFCSTWSFENWRKSLG